MDSNHLQVNAIVWASDISKAEEIASKFTSDAQQTNGFYTTTISNYTLNTYVRSPYSFSTAAPSAISNILIVYLASVDESSEAKKYLDSRKGIPIKVLCSELNLLEESESLDCKYTNITEVMGEGRETIIKEAVKFEETLLNCFNKFDVNGNGYISVQELVEVSSELGHTLELDDAEMIANSLDETKTKSGINLNGFKKWWVTGKSDFSLFRRICKAELSLNKLVKLSSKKFNNYLENLKTESQNVSQEEISQGINLNIHSKQSFENGIGMYCDVCTGNDAKEIINSQPEKVSKSPVAFSLRVNFSNTESATTACELLNSMVLPMLSELPEVSSFLLMGLEISFRVSGSSLVMDVFIGSLIADMFMSQLQNFDFQSLNANSNLTFHLFTAMNFQNLLNDHLFDLLEKVLHLKLHFNTKSYGLRALLSNLTSQLDSAAAEVDEAKNKRLRNMLSVIQASLMLKNFNLDLSFDAVDLKNVFYDIVCYHTNEYGKPLEEAQQKVLAGEDAFNLNGAYNQLRMMYESVKQQAVEMKSMIPEEMLDTAKSVSLEKIQLEIQLNTPTANVFVKYNLHLNGLNGVRDEILG